MRIVALVFAAAIVMPAAGRAAPVETLFQQFGLFGAWAAVCQQPASPANPHVSVTMPSPGLVFEDDDLGPDYAANRYSMLAAKQISATRLSVDAIFQPGRAGEERQTLVFRVRKGARRTMFNQAEGGAVRVRDGVTLARHKRTPALHKCQ